LRNVVSAFFISFQEAFISLVSLAKILHLLGHDVQKYPITFHFRTRSLLRALAKHITVEIEALADVQGYIGEFIDVITEAVNERLTLNGLFNITGGKIKVVEDDFISAADAAQRMKVSGNPAENTASKLIGITPALGAGNWTVEAKAQYNGSSSTLKSPWAIASAFTLTVPASTSWQDGLLKFEIGRFTD
jgi:hypothetical protein